jgi:hypothetical protein
VIGLIGIQYLSRGWRSITWTWLIVVFMMVMFMPGRQLSDTIWMVIPLYIPAAIFLSRIKLHSEENPILIGVVVALLGVYTVYFLYSLTQYLPNATIMQGDSQNNVYLFSAVISFVILALILVVIAWGWSIAISLDAARVLGLGFVIFAMLVSGLKSAGFDSQPSQLMSLPTRFPTTSSRQNIVTRRTNAPMAIRLKPCRGRRACQNRATLRIRKQAAVLSAMGM